MKEVNEKASSKTAWAGTKWSDGKWMTDPMENLLLTLVTTNLDFTAVQLNHCLEKYSTGEKKIFRGYKEALISLNSFNLTWERQMAKVFDGQTWKEHVD